jgi:hypothetical protein
MKNGSKMINGYEYKHGQVVKTYDWDEYGNPCLWLQVYNGKLCLMDNGSGGPEDGIVKSVGAADRWAKEIIKEWKSCGDYKEEETDEPAVDIAMEGVSRFVSCQGLSLPPVSRLFWNHPR